MLFFLLLTCLTSLSSAVPCDFTRLQRHIHEGSLQSFLGYLKTCEVDVHDGGRIIYEICVYDFPYQALVAVLQKLGNEQDDVKLAVLNAVNYGRADLLAGFAEYGYGIFGGDNLMLYTGAAKGHVDVVELCLELEIDYSNVGNDTIRLELHNLVSRKDFRMLYCLAGNGVETHRSCPFGAPVLRLSSFDREAFLPQHDYEIARYLVERMQDEESVAFLFTFAIRASNRMLIEELLGTREAVQYLQKVKYASSVMLSRYQQELIDLCVKMGEKGQLGRLDTVQLARLDQFCGEFVGLLQEAGSGSVLLEPLTVGELEAIFSEPLDNLSIVITRALRFTDFFYRNPSGGDDA